MGMLDNLTSAINQYVGVAENEPKSLDVNGPGGTVHFGALGDFANQIDQSAQRQYLETGYIRNVRPHQLEILMQEPDITVLVKKRMFSSLVENFKPELMDGKERLFYRASKKLFQNKCELIAAYERLSKIDRIVANGGVLNDYFFPIIAAEADVLAQNNTLLDAKTRSVIATLQKIKAFSDPSQQTSWLKSVDVPVTDLGSGTGVIEFTTVSSINCSSSVLFGQGNASVTLEDPYRLMLITNEDIDKAIRDSAGGFVQNSFFSFSQEQLEKTITDLRRQLNSIRRNRGASDIQFFTNEDSLLFKKVRAIIDQEAREILFNYDGGLGGIGSNIDIDQSAFEGTNGLDRSNQEVTIFSQILKNIYLLMGMHKTNQSTSFQFNKSTNYVRRKMRLHFGGKPIIQPMDVIHIFVSTKTTIDPKTATVVANSFGMGDILNSINDTVAGIENSINNIAASFSGNTFGQTYAVTEKNAIAGEEFPMWLWNIMRNDFTRQAAGTHVFAGVVQRAPHNYSDGRYTLSVSANDNCAYFKFGQLNINPSVEVFNSALYDPLTPRELDFDAATGFLNSETPPLLPENIQLLNSGLLKFKNGRFRGYPANEQIYGSFDIEKIKNSTDRFSVRRKYEDPDGFVYRWKEGIQSLTLMSEPHPNSELPGDSSPNLSKDPFAGQDVMNVLSLLISGTPYNFNTFMKAAISSGSLTRDDLTNDGGSKSFYRGLLSDIAKQNATWGNFIPFKKLVVNESAYNVLRSGQLDAVTVNRRITDLLQQRARSFDLLVKSAPYFANNPQFLNVDQNGNLVNKVDALSGFNDALNDFVDPIATAKLSSDIIRLDFEIEQAKKAFEDSIQNSSLNTNDGSINIFGDDISYDPSINGGQNNLTPSDIARERAEFRKRILFLTQRRLWKVKANEDQNLFIVDDQYDKNYDIQAFEKSLGSLNLFKSTYVDPASKISMVADLLGLEVFADSQGHIQARPPQYNKMPTSVFYEMIRTKDITGVQIFPPYLETLFTNQVRGLADKIEIIEDEIRIRAAALGYTTDQSAKTMLSGAVAGGGSTNFAFATNESDGKFGGKDIRVMLDQVNPDLSGADANTSLKSVGNALNSLKKTLGEIIDVTSGQLRSGSNFDIVQRINIVNKTSFDVGASDQEINDKITEIGKRLLSKTNQPPPTKLTLLSVDNISAGYGTSQLDVLNLTQQIAQFVSDRQSTIKLLANAIKNLDEGIALNTSTEPGRTAMLPFLNKTKMFPETLEHMLEDEDVDDLGYGSGSRYIIKENQIINRSIVEETPQHTTVEVTGLYGEGLADPPGGFDTGGGNPIITAWAVDFDMWRMYGFRAPMTVQAPFLSNPDTQCAPYAVSLLNKARREIFQGEVTLVGNEFIQPGEVYYFEDLDMLFYAEKVNHSFNYGGSFTTSVSLKYGHNPGEYIPTILDIVGKALYTNKHQADLVRHNRHGNSNGDVSVATIVFEDHAGQFSLDPEPIKALVSGSYGDQNRKSLGNLLLAISGALTPTTYGKTATIELRSYYDTVGGYQKNQKLTDLTSAIKQWMLNPSKTNISGDDMLPDTQQYDSMHIDESSIQTVSIDLSEQSDSRSPSQSAIARAKEIAASSGSTMTTDPVNDVDKLDPALRPTMFGKIIDVWITFAQQSQTTEITSQQQQANQSAQDNLDKALAAFNEKIKSMTGGGK